ncbi:MAG: helix-turn-helix domain-containing protein [Candidatus Woesearchaeota archaeon]|jgi:sugar-specific transcriptional regulator TrmB
MNAFTLQDVGLTKGESAVYLTLLRLGQSKTGQLSKEAGVSSSKVYKILDRLEKKGLAGHVLQGKVRFFTAMNPERLLDYVNAKEKQLEEQKSTIKEMLPLLEQERLLSGLKSEAAIYSGFKAVTNLFRSIIDELKKGDTYYVIGASYGDVPGLRAFFHQHHQRRADKGIFLKMLANDGVRLEKTTALHSDVRFLPKYLITHMQILFYRNKTYIILWAKNPVAFYIESSEIARSYKVYFDSFWKKSLK